MMLDVLPVTGRGTIRRMVEGHARTLCPSTTYGGPPPLAGVEV